MRQFRNYSKELKELLPMLPKESLPKLLLHACCAPCSSYVLEYLSKYFSIFLLYYNPNIAPEEEYKKRKAELAKLISAMPLENPVVLVPCKYRHEDFLSAAKGYETEPEGGARCLRCYRMRLAEAAQAAKRLSCDYFTTTLSISPLKDAQALNRIGEELSVQYGVKHLPADFKKNDGYKRSIQLSREYGLYRQDYCGCVYSKQEAELRRRKKERERENASIS